MKWQNDVEWNDVIRPAILSSSYVVCITMSMIAVIKQILQTWKLYMKPSSQLYKEQSGFQYRSVWLRNLCIFHLATLPLLLHWQVLAPISNMLQQTLDKTFTDYFKKGQKLTALFNSQSLYLTIVTAFLNRGLVLPTLSFFVVVVSLPFTWITIPLVPCSF